MNRPKLRIPPLLSYLTGKQRRNRADRQAHDELLGKGQGVFPKGLEVSWLGTSGFRLSYQGHVIAIDPYVSRVPARRVLTGRPLQSNRALVQGIFSDVNAVLVGHTHFDHALDVPAVAECTKATVYGSTSSTKILALHGLEAQAVTVEPFKEYREGPFVIRFIPSVHSRLVLGLAVPAGGEITCDHFDSLGASQYRCGDVYGICVEVAGIKIYHQGSADCVDDALRDKDVDVFLSLIHI